MYEYRKIKFAFSTIEEIMMNSAIFVIMFLVVPLSSNQVLIKTRTAFLTHLLFMTPYGRMV